VSAVLAVRGSEEHFRALYAAMPDEEILRLASEGGLRPEAEVAFSEQVRLRRIMPEAIEAERRRQAHADLQIAVGTTPFIRVRGVGLRFREKTFRSKEDEEQGVSVRTRWFCMWYLPMIPFGSFRIRETAEVSRGYEIMSREKLEWHHVRLGLRWTAAVFVFLLLASAWILRLRRG